MSQQPDMQRMGCPHADQASARRVCLHLLEQKDDGHFQRFTGVGLRYDLVCTGCAEEPNAIDDRLRRVCSACFQAIQGDSTWDGIVGSPEIPIGSSNLRFCHEDIELPDVARTRILAIEPIEGSTGAWLACTATGGLIEIDPIRRLSRAVAQVPRRGLAFDGQFIREPRLAKMPGPSCFLRVSRDGKMVAVANRYGRGGVVLDLSTGKVSMRLRRDSHHFNVTSFPLAFCNLDNRLLLIHGTAWNRLDISDARTGALLTRRRSPRYWPWRPEPPHYLDYWHSQLSVSPGQQFIVDNGWAWHPNGVPATWSLLRWLHDNVWESEDGPSRRDLCYRGGYWDGPCAG